MADDFLWQSALADRAPLAQTTPEHAAVQIKEQPRQNYVGLRGRSEDTAFAAGVEAATTVNLPLSAMSASVSFSGRRRLFWLGPDEWLFCHDDLDFDAITALETALAGHHHAVVDMRDSRTAFNLTGPRAADLLAKGSTLDLHPRHFGVGRCANSTFAAAHALLHCDGLDAEGVRIFDLYVHRSFADYVWTWLHDSAAEFWHPVHEGADSYSGL